MCVNMSLILHWLLAQKFKLDYTEKIETFYDKTAPNVKTKTTVKLQIFLTIWKNL